mmetsp:Transcript_6066/g.37599  ORF Transcript_6066/g.37599 Transcript_6066/m.37599 type:complete len:341 (-) Transcript_6066:2313-3335(-)
MDEKIAKPIPSRCASGIGGMQRAAVVGCLALFLAGVFFACLGRNAPLKPPGLPENDTQPAQMRAYRRSMHHCALEENPFPRDYWFVKTKKVGGSTLRRLFLNLDKNYGIQPIPLPGQRKGMPSQEIAVQQKGMVENQTNAKFYALQEHIRYSRTLKDRLFNNPLLFTATRHPLDRAYSHYYFKMQVNKQQVIRQGDGVGWKDTVVEYFQFLEKTRDFVYRYTRGDVNNSNAEDVLNQYDFVFVTERFDESLILFKLKYNLTLEDVQYKVPAKFREGKYPSAKDKPQWLNNATMSYFPTDLRIWQIANKKLDDLRRKVIEKCGERALELEELEFQQSKGSN